jgi:hypothetical protein
MAFFENDPLSPTEAIERAQHIAFAPMVFQASRALRTLGILEALYQHRDLTMEDIVSKTGLSRYGVRVLIEAGLGIGLVTCKDGAYNITRTGWFILNDKMTVANMDFSHDVCYEGLESLDQAIVTGKPTGLKAFGDWSTIYQGLAYLPDAAKKSWFAFDHYYSDDAYPLIMPLLASYNLKSILDIGGNTGRFTLQCLRHFPEIRVGIVDLPNMARSTAETMQKLGHGDRVSVHAANMLEPQNDLPTGYDAVWMSQFLDCFSEDEIVSILQKVRAVMTDETYVFIMEPFWDRQSREASAFSLQMTSLYFTALANGNSQMYGAELFVQLVERAGLRIEKEIDNIGLCQTLLVCRRA